MEKSKNKVEQKAITKVRNLIDDIEYFTYSFKEMDKNISWDGTIEMYNGNIDKKENYDYTLDVQVKGRTTYNKKFSSKYRFQLDKTDLQNYLKKDGTILIVCLFDTDGNNHKLHYANLLPYNIRSLLKQYTNNKIKIDTKEIKNSEQFEIICRNFKLDKEMQKGIKTNMFDEHNLTSSEGKVTKFYTWNKNPEDFNPQILVGAWKYIYTLDENGYAINVSYGMFCNLVESINVKVSSKDMEIIFNDVKLETTTKGKKILFGKAFTIDFINNKFNINICGFLEDRINQLQFVNKIFSDCGFLINDMNFAININASEQSKFKNLLKKYIDLSNFFKKHKINKKINFDKWEDKDFYKLEKWIDAIENKSTMKLNSDISLLGSIAIKDLRLSIFAGKREDGKFDITSLWNSNISNKFYFRYENHKEDYIETNNFYLVLNSEAYQSDDVNFEEMKKSFCQESLSDGELTLMNFQLLEVLKAYDITKRLGLLEYAKYLSDILLQRDNSFVNYINYAQILKRENNITDETCKKLLKIRDNSDEVEIKIACNILLENKKEVSILIEKLDTQTLEEFKKYPIAVYL